MDTVREGLSLTLLVHIVLICVNVTFSFISLNNFHPVRLLDVVFSFLQASRTNIQEDVVTDRHSFL